MKKKRSRATKTGLLIAIILMLAVAVIIQAGFMSASSTADQDEYVYWDDMDEAYDDPGLVGSGYGSASSSTHANQAAELSSPAPTAVVKSSGSTPSQDLKNANGLVTALRRIVRAGQKMDLLRSTSNHTLRRRCVEGMKKLQNEALQIRSRRKNIALPSASTPLGKVFGNIMRCASCDDDANNYCAIAQKDLDEISRSLSLN